MGKIKQGILGGFAGKVGPVVGSSWKGIAVIKSKPLSVANPRTSSQVNQRTRFTGATNFATSILSTFIKPLWDRFALRMSGYNAWMSVNLQSFSTAGGADFPNLVMSRGDIASFQDFAATPMLATETQLYLSWTDNSGSGDSLATDMVYVCVFDNDGALLGVNSAGVRDDSAVDFSLSRAVADPEPIHVFAAFRRQDGTKVSNSVYSTFTVS